MSVAPRALVIVGMHRSGTSALARLLHTLGVDFGSGHLPAGPANELGFFEKAAVADVNERLLLALGLESGSDPSPLPPGWREHPACEAARADLVELLQSDFAEVPLWGVKDPRISRLVPLWIDVVRDLGREPAFVHVTRHPLEVAESLRVRQGLGLRDSQLLWLRHVLEGDRATRGHPRVFVTYDQLLEDWSATAGRIARTLEVSWPVAPDSLADDAQPRLPGTLRHHRRADDALGDDEGVARWVGIAYRALLARRDGDESGPTRRLDELRRNLEAGDELLVGRIVSGETSTDAAPALRYSGRLRWDQGQLDTRETVGEIVSERQIELEFVAENGSFCGFDLLFGTYARTNTSTLDVTLQIENAGGALEEAHAWSLAAGEIENDRWRAFRCPPQPESRGRRCQVRLSSADAAPGDAVTVYCDPEGRPAYRAYFVELGAPDAPEAAAEAVEELEERTLQLEDQARARDALIDDLTARVQQLGDSSTLDQVVDWSGRVPGIEERIGRLELGSASKESLAGIEARLQALEPRLEAEMTNARDAIASLRESVASARADALAGVENLRADLAEQRGRIEPVVEQLQVMRELLTATREAGESARRDQQSRLGEVGRAIESRLAEMRSEEAALRDALEETTATGRSERSVLERRLHGLEAGHADEVRHRRAHDETIDERIARFESILLAAVERIDALNRRTASDLAAIGEALEEAWE